jgi:hypothetical protein
MGQQPLGLGWHVPACPGRTTAVDMPGSMLLVWVQLAPLTEEEVSVRCVSQASPESWRTY